MASPARRLRALLLVGAAVVAVVAAVRWWRDAGRAPSPATTARTPEREEVRGPRGPRSQVDDGSTAPHDDGAAAEPRAPEPAPATARLAPAPTKETDPATRPLAPVRPLAELKDEAGRRIRDAARPCMRDDEVAAASGQTITFRYTLVLGAGLGRVARVGLVDSDLVDDGLVDCILGTIGDLEWTVTDAAPAELVVHDSIRLSDLRIPG
jgi:hypothetical protein